MMVTRSSTPEEILARQKEIAEAECRGEVVHWDCHDWRLWERLWVPEHGWQTTWYCTRCRKIEEAG